MNESEVKKKYSSASITNLILYVSLLEMTIKRDLFKKDLWFIHKNACKY